MFSTNPFYVLSESVSPIFMQIFVILMIALIVIGTVMDIIHKKNVVMVGDAALSMLPYMAQGANKALEDSWELANCIKEFPIDINKALNNYSKKRIRRIHQLDQVSRLNEKVYHLEQRVLRKILFVFLRCLTRFSPNLFLIF